jgi:HK97 family phage major capsid protein
MPTKLAVPTTAEGLQEFLTDKKKLNTLMDEGSFPEFMTNYVTEFGKANVDVDARVKEQVDAALATFARENNVAEWRKNGQKLTAAQVREDDFSARKSASKWNEQAPGKVLDGKFTGLFDFLKKVDHHADPREEEIGKIQKEIRNAMSSTDPGSGGFLIPEEFRSQLLRVALESAIVRPRARVIPMASLRTSWPAIDSTTNAGSVYGGIIGYWTEEGAALIQSQPAFLRIALEAKKLTAYTEVPNELIQDSSPSVDALVNELFPEAVAWFEDTAFLRGTGVGEPLGVLNAQNNALVTVAAEGGQATGTILWENIINMYSRMLPASLNSAVWLASPNTFPQLATMALNVGTGGSAIWLNNGSEGAPVSILGRPVIFTEKAAALGGAGDLSFIDFNQYLLGDRMAMSAEVSPHYKFGNDVTAYRFIERVDGRPWMQSAVTPANGGPTLSPYLQLAAR